MARGINIKPKAAAESSEQDEVGETDGGGEEGKNAESSSTYVAPPLATPTPLRHLLLWSLSTL